MPSKAQFVRVVLPVPLRKYFDYLASNTGSNNVLSPGMRVRVPFGKNKYRIGIITAVTSSSEIDADKLKTVADILDEKPVFPENHIKLLDWASNYYHHPVGEVFFSALPTALRHGTSARQKTDHILFAIESGGEDISGILKNAPKQLAIYKYVSKFPVGLATSNVNEKFANAYSSINSLIDKGLLKKKQEIEREWSAARPKPITLNKNQSNAVNEITKSLDTFHTFLIHGVTGSGKTEVYLRCIENVIKQGKQALILVPEIGLTPQLIKRFQEFLNSEISILHSSLSATERLNNWLRAREGKCNVILGTRSAIWVPLKSPGIIVIDEEHDLSYKQQTGFRYSARDMAIIRAKHENIPVVLGSATPSLETLHNVGEGKFSEIKLLERTGSSKLPVIEIIDMRGEKITGAFSETLLKEISKCISNSQQVLLFQNRRGYAPAVICHDCGEPVKCSRCDVPMTYHKYNNRLRCHHCDHQEPLINKCPVCSGTNILQIGYGTERLYETLSTYFPGTSITRIDRDTTRRKDSLESIIEQISSGNPGIIIGTQMLAKGHDFPNLTLVGIIDTDRGLFSTDYRASERMAQIITQVSGRAGRAEKPGKVFIQTYYPQHPILTTLFTHGYEKYASLVLEERKQAGLPPYSYHTLLRAEANDISLAEKFLDNAKNHLKNETNLEIFGPLISPIEKISGRYRMQLILQSRNRTVLGNILTRWIPKIENEKLAGKIRWSIDIDPQDLS